MGLESLRECGSLGFSQAGRLLDARGTASREKEPVSPLKHNHLDGMSEDEREEQSAEDVEGSGSSSSKDGASEAEKNAPKNS